jgi:PAS domain S-box-containing protein
VTSKQKLGDATHQSEQIWSRSYLRAFACLLALGGLLGLFNPITLGGFSTPMRSAISFFTGVSLLLLLGILLKTGRLVTVVMLAAPVALFCFCSGFILTGDLYYITLGMTLPIAVALFAGPKNAITVLAIYSAGVLLISTTIQLEIWTPPVDRNAYLAGLVPESIILILITVAITGSTIWKEQMVAEVRKAEAKANARVVAQQRRFETVSQSAYDAIFETDEHGVVTLAHGRLIAQLGLDSERLVSENLLSLISRKARVKVLRELKSLNEQKKHFCLEICVQSTHRRSRWVRVSSGSFIDVEGNLKWVSTVQDIDNAMVSMGRVMEQSRLESLGTVCGGLAHDFNNLLTVIGIYGELVEKEDIRKGILESQRQASDLTASLLTFARKQEFREQTIHMGDFLRTNQRMIERMVPENIEFRLSVENQAVHVCVDPAQLQQVVINLVNNATQAMEHGGKLTVKVDLFDANHQRAAIHGVQEGAFVRLSVTDTGTGMSPEIAMRSLEPFFTTKPRGQGTGLGLATAHGTARRAGGWIDVMSDVGEGTQVSVLLPQADAANLRRTADENSGASQQEKQQILWRILLIEDRDTLREAISQILVDAGHEVVSCTTGEEGLARYKDRAPFDLVITDIVLPGMSGLAWLRRVRQSVTDAKAILISGHLQDDISIVNERPDITWFLPKPFSTSELLSLVQQVQVSTPDELVSDSN